MAVSVEARPAPAKAMTVSDKQAALAARPVGGRRYKRVKPTRFKSPREDPCDKRRQSKPKNRHFQRKSHWIDDVCNNTHPSTPKTQRTRRDSMATLKPTTPLHPKTEPKRPFRTRKGDGGFNPTRARARASRGDDGFSRGSAGTRKGDRGFRQAGRLVDRARLRCPWAARPRPPQKSHAIRLDEDSITSENVAISTL